MAFEKPLDTLTDQELNESKTDILMEAIVGIGQHLANTDRHFNPEWFKEVVEDWNSLVEEIKSRREKVN